MQNADGDWVRLKDGTDLVALSRAVARHETNSCTSWGNSVAVNNCFGIGGAGNFWHYDTPEDSYKDFRRLWATKYGSMPDANMAGIYSGNDRSGVWLKNVTSFYNEYTS